MVVGKMNARDLELFRLKAELCKTFSDPKRLIILDELRKGEKAVGELAQILGISQGVVTPRREGTNVFYRLADDKICEACDLVHEILIKQIEKNRELSDRLIS